MSPGAMHHARWMPKVIYSIKTWMFKTRFQLTYRRERIMRCVSVQCSQFVSKMKGLGLKMKAWISAPQAVTHQVLLTATEVIT